MKNHDGIVVMYRYEEERFVRLVTSRKDRKEKQKLQVRRSCGSSVGRHQ